MGRSSRRGRVRQRSEMAGGDSRRREENEDRVGK